MEIAKTIIKCHIREYEEKIKHYKDFECIASHYQVQIQLHQLALDGLEEQEKKTCRI